MVQKQKLLLCADNFPDGMFFKVKFNDSRSVVDIFLINYNSAEEQFEQSSVLVGGFSIGIHEFIINVISVVCH